MFKILSLGELDYRVDYYDGPRSTPKGKIMDTGAREYKEARKLWQQARTSRVIGCPNMVTRSILHGGNKF